MQSSYAILPPFCCTNKGILAPQRRTAAAPIPAPPSTGEEVTHARRQNARSLRHRQGPLHRPPWARSTAPSTIEAGQMGRHPNRCPQPGDQRKASAALRPRWESCGTASTPTSSASFANGRYRRHALLRPWNMSRAIAWTKVMVAAAGRIRLGGRFRLVSSSRKV